MPINRWMTAIRYAAIGRGHCESFYLTGNHPSRRLGLWLDGETGQHTVVQRVLPCERVEARLGPTMLRLGDALLELGPEG